jgi:hypothetical protein
MHRRSAQLAAEGLLPAAHRVHRLAFRFQLADPDGAGLRVIIVGWAAVEIKPQAAQAF